MARYIDAEKFKQQLESAMKKMHLKGLCDIVDVVAVIKALDMQPTADVVPVVRCKNCNHLTEDGFCFKNINGVGGYKKPKADDFCSYGERRTNG